MSAIGVEASPIFTAVFYLVAVVVVASSVLVVQLRNVFKSALALVVVFIGGAGLLVMLNAEFVAVVQVLIYGGAIPVLIIFAIMLTKDVEINNPSNGLVVTVALVSVFIATAIAFSVFNTEWDFLEYSKLAVDNMEAVNLAFSDSTPLIGLLLFNQYVLAFEVASVVLLASIVGALVIMREE